MRSAFAVFLRGFTLPFGATSGRRIVFDGIGGAISIYRADNTLALQLGDPAGANEDAVNFFTGDADEGTGGRVTTGVGGVGGARNLTMDLWAPTFAGATQIPLLQLRSQSQDGTEPPEFGWDANATHGKFRIPAAIGSAVLVAGTVTVNRPVMVGAGFSRVFLSRRTVGGTPGFLSYTQVAGTSFTINSTSPTDTSTVEWAVFDE